VLEQALILAGGLGTRFRSVRDDIPKGLAPVGGKPVLEHQIQALAQAGVSRVVLCVGYLYEQIEQHLGSGERFGLELAYSVETEALGTAGAVAHAKDLVQDSPFCVLNGDTLMPDLDFQSLFDRHEHTAASVSMVVTPAPDAGAYGVLELGEDARRVTGYREKAELGTDYSNAWISAGVYVFPYQIFDLIPSGRLVSMENEVFPKLLERNQLIAAFPYHGFFGDMGTPSGYTRTDNYLSCCQESTP